MCLSFDRWCKDWGSFTYLRIRWAMATFLYSKKARIKTNKRSIPAAFPIFLAALNPWNGREKGRTLHSVHIRRFWHNKTLVETSVYRTCSDIHERAHSTPNEQMLICMLPPFCSRAGSLRHLHHCYLGAISVLTFLRNDKKPWGIQCRG